MTPPTLTFKPHVKAVIEIDGGIHECALVPLEIPGEEPCMVVVQHVSPRMLNPPQQLVDAVEALKR